MTTAEDTRTDAEREEERAVWAARAWASLAPFTCPKCRVTSYTPHDMRVRVCRYCARRNEAAS